MGCNCGGSSRVAAQQELAKRRQTPPSSVSPVATEGYYWTGPKRNTETAAKRKPAKPE